MASRRKPVQGARRKPPPTIMISEDLCIATCNPLVRVGSARAREARDVVAIYRLGERRPQIHPSAYVHESAVLIGAVVLGARASIWPCAVLRADNEPIEIGEETNVQDGCVLHTDPGLPVRVGMRVSVGHQSMLHGCMIGDGSLIGIQAVILNECVVGRNCLIGAAALLTERKQIPDESMVVGAPGRVLRALRPEEIEHMARNALEYVRRAALFGAELQRLA